MDLDRRRRNGAVRGRGDEGGRATRAAHLLHSCRLALGRAVCAAESIRRAGKTLATRGIDLGGPMPLLFWTPWAAFLLVGVLWLGSLPRPLFADPYSLVVTDRSGGLLGATIADDGQWRFPPAGAIPEKYVRALVRFEDRRFFQHGGVDPLAIVRALGENLQAGDVVSGGSTITMQVIRLARKNRPRTLSEKAIEAALAVRLELGASKSQVLRLFAAHAPFGGNVVGIEAAAWRYFGRSPESLSWAEAALLAVLPNSPALIHPGRNRDALAAKRNQLLGELHADGAFDEDTLRLAQSEPLPQAPRPIPQLASQLVGSVQSGTFADELPAVSRPFLSRRTPSARIRTTLRRDLRNSGRRGSFAAPCIP